MHLRNTPEAYGLVAQALHWLVVVLVAAAWILGTVNDELPRGAARTAGMLVHIWAGLAILALLAARLVWRITDPPPPPEGDLGALAESAGRLVHFALYALPCAVVVVGMATLFAGGNALSVFGLLEIASPLPANRKLSHSLKEVHEVLANALLALAALHAAAALVHHWVLRDHTLERMLPWARRS